jgi:hypothetical protein
MMRAMLAFLAFGIVSAPSTASAFGGLKSVAAKIANETYRGCRSVRVEPAMGPESPTASGLALIPKRVFHNGVIELRIAGEVARGADSGARGFVGIAFRVQTDRRHFEMFYLRPTNGRADNQLRRNHSLQYVSEPEFPWERLRGQTPGQYESYADLQPDVWTRVRIEVHGVKARLFVNGASQPSLIVNDLKHGDTSGAIALWAGPGAIAHFCMPELIVRPTRN